MKSLIACLLAGVLAVLGGSAVAVYILDPYFQYHDPDVTGDIWIDERYQASGLLRSQDYDTILIGTSLAANYQPSWFDAAFDAQTVQITLPNGAISEFDTVLTFAYTCQEVERVVVGLDANILARNVDEDPDELPVYLYNHTMLDDLPYLLNKDILAKSIYYAMEEDPALTPLDEGFLWDYWFSKEQALVSYPRPDISDETQSEDYYLANADAHLEIVARWLEENPTVEYHFYLSPYAILFWDKMDREGTTEAMLTMLEHTMTTLLAYDNATVHFFMDDETIITNLDNYTDHIHTSTAVTSAMVTAMAEGTYVVSEENLVAKVDGLRQLVVDYDYESIFE
ncbi:hypothetical protein RFF05_11955 [Bengtsoniella intestinalis]|uniref:hypothetical protein n=1 Tax=Bengtsoniella intestinalis TaxID=3073143 RepID=UPI00391F20B6